MKSTFLCLTLLVSLAACETSIDGLIGLPGGGGLTAAQASGNWTFTVHPASSCASLSLADGAVLTAHFEVLSTGGLGSGTSTWQSPSSATLFPVTGAVGLGSGSIAAILSTSSGSAMDLNGTITSAGTFSGTIRDPRAGSLPVFAVCEYTTTGSKTG